MKANINKLPFWDKLTEEERLNAMQSVVIKSYEAGQMLHGSCDGGGSCLGMVYVLDGELRTFIVSPEGREVTLFKLIDDDYCVFAASCVLSRIHQETQMIATKDTELMIIPATVFAKLIQTNLKVRCWTYELATEKFSEVMSVLEEIIFTPLDSRLARYLVQQYMITGSNVIKTTQEQVAQEINSVREVVARALNKFAKNGIVSMHRGTIEIKSINELKYIIGE